MERTDQWSPWLSKSFRFCPSLVNCASRDDSSRWWQLIISKHRKLSSNWNSRLNPNNIHLRQSKLFGWNEFNTEWILHFIHVVLMSQASRRNDAWISDDWKCMVIGELNHPSSILLAEMDERWHGSLFQIFEATDENNGWEWYVLCSCHFLCRNTYWEGEKKIVVIVSGQPHTVVKVRRPSPLVSWIGQWTWIPRAHTQLHHRPPALHFYFNPCIYSNNFFNIFKLLK